MTTLHEARAGRIRRADKSAEEEAAAQQLGSKRVNEAAEACAPRQAQVSAARNQAAADVSATGVEVADGRGGCEMKSSDAQTHPDLSRITHARFSAAPLHSCPRDLSMGAAARAAGAAECVPRTQAIRKRKLRGGAQVGHALLRPRLSPHHAVRRLPTLAQRTPGYVWTRHSATANCRSLLPSPSTESRRSSSACRLDSLSTNIVRTHRRAHSHEEPRRCRRRNLGTSLLVYISCSWADSVCRVRPISSYYPQARGSSAFV